ncbi:MAG: UPF0280 family protein [Candidatus Nezhaarchaeota archaeon]|nr:UPF0280 family protein [Candidatus Nezhaarchaeota archaeon]MCX8142378.1 UPF0280 family protein [Candidatus Nezhaarchaeota archaeon]MDW8050649.1 UPF0280 family protein [Nitrososphaerota archaeon]
MTKLVKFFYEIGESKGVVKCDSVEGARAAIKAIEHHRRLLEKYILRRPEFKYALEPIDVEDGAPTVVQRMVEVSKIAGVGPMAAVAGVLADLALETALSVGSKIVMVENGGEVAMTGDYTFKVKINAGSSLISGKIGLKVAPSDMPIGIATSSGTYGHALSFGIADAVTVVADNAGLADAAATAVCNMVQGEDLRKALERGLEKAKEIGKVRGVIIVLRDLIGLWGKVPQIIVLRDQEHHHLIA